jgi:AraC family cel operon transcriptional repressor
MGGTRLHTQDFGEVFWVTEGEGVYLFGNKQYTLKTGGMGFAPAWIKHAYMTNDTMTLVNVAFPLALSKELPVLFHMAGFVLKKADAYLCQMDSYSLIEAENEMRKLASSPLTELYLRRFLMNLLCEMQKQDCQRPLPSPDWLSCAYRAIQELPLLREGVPGFVRLAGRSHAHVSRCTRNYYGISPGKVVLEARLKKASELLLMTAIPIKELCYSLGFESLGYFYSVFKRRYGIPPKAYRNRRSTLVGG